MLILLILLLLVPPMISVLLYERFRGCALPNQKRVILLLIFAFLINMIEYAAIWLRGWTYISWTLDGASSMTGVSFVLKYMALSLASAVIIPYVICLIRSKPAPAADDTEDGAENNTDISEEDSEDIVPQ